MESLSSVLSRGNEELSAFCGLDEDEADLLLDDSYGKPSSAGVQSPHSETMHLGLDDSQSKCLSLEAALSEALSSRTLTPLLKEELRCKIQLRRLQHGKEEITPDFSTKSFAMSMEEVVKKNKKMQQNRMSAQRSRDRQKSLEKNIQSRLELLERENNQLAEEAKSLRHACHVARQWLQQHRSCLQHTVTRSLLSATSPPDSSGQCPELPSPPSSGSPSSLDSLSSVSCSAACAVHGGQCPELDQV